MTEGAPGAGAHAEEQAYARGGVEFGRIVGFSDGIFGIAMTLLVAGIAVPEVARADLGRALVDGVNDIFAFALSFSVISRAPGRGAARASFRLRSAR